MQRVSFTDLYDTLTAAGLRVGVTVTGRGHDIVISDGGERLVRMPVQRCFDRTAAVLVAGMQLRGVLGGLPPFVACDREVRGEWPEFLLLWPGHAGRLDAG